MRKKYSEEAKLYILSFKRMIFEILFLIIRNNIRKLLTRKLKQKNTHIHILSTKKILHLIPLIP